MSDTPRTPAAFINAIADEGTKTEAVEWLQKTWDEKCQLERENAELRAWKEGKKGVEDYLALKHENAELRKKLEQAHAALNKDYCADPKGFFRGSDGNRPSHLGEAGGERMTEPTERTKQIIAKLESDDYEHVRAMILRNGKVRVNGEYTPEELRAMADWVEAQRGND